MLGGINRSQDMEAITGGYIDKLLADPGRINQELNSWRGAPELRRILSVSDEQALRQYGSDTVNLESAPIIKLQQRAEFLGQEGITELIEPTKAGTARIKRVIADAGGKESPLGSAMRQGVIRKILKASTAPGPEDGFNVVQPGIFNSIVQRLDQEGLLGIIMTPEDIVKLKDAQFFLSFLPSTSDPGAQIATASIGGGLSTLSRFIPSSIRIGQLDLWARVMMHPQSNKFFFGKGRLAGRKLNAAARSAAFLKFFVPVATVAAQAMRDDAEELFKDEDMTVVIPVSELAESIRP
jgi:hypothetical protein